MVPRVVLKPWLSRQFSLVMPLSLPLLVVLLGCPNPLKDVAQGLANARITVQYENGYISNGSKCDFGSILIGSSRSATFTIGNPGTADLILAGSPFIKIGGGSSSEFKVGMQPKSPVAPGGSTSFTLDFNPTTAGIKAATVLIGSYVSSQSPFTVNISATCTTIPRPRIHLKQGQTDIGSPSGTFSFGDTVIASSKSLDFTIQNLGDADLTVASVSLSGTSASDFAITAQPSSVISSGGSTVFSMVFTPLIVGHKSAIVTIDSSDLDYNPYAFEITGDAISAPDITPPQVYSTSPFDLAAGVPIALDITATFSENMDASSINTTTFLVKDSANAPITGSVTFSASNFAAHFVPTVALSYSATYTATITSGASDLAGNKMTSPHTWSFTTGGVIASVSSTSLDFGNVAVNQILDKSVTVYNDSASLGSITGNVSISGSGYTVISGGGSYNLAPGGSRAITVRFNPTSSGSKSGNLNITHNATSTLSPISVPLTGMGQEYVSISVSPMSLDFGHITVGQYLDKTFTIYNSSSSTSALVGSIAVSGTDYTLISGGGSFNLSPGYSRNVSVRFSPTSNVTRNGSVTVSHNATTSATPITVSLAGVGDAIVWSAYTNADSQIVGLNSIDQNMGTQQSIFVGAATSDPSRALIDFDVASSLPYGARVVQATLQVYETGYVSTPFSVRIAWITGSWSESTVTWRNQPTSTYYTNNTFNIPSSVGYLPFDVTSEVQAMVTNGLNNGLMILAVDEYASHFFFFDSRETIYGSSRRPLLTVKYLP